MQESKGEYGSDVMVDVLKSLGVDYASMNPGASYRGLHDSIVNYGGNKNPEIILCCHEAIAVAIASGYYRATGRPMAVLVHDLEGLLHASKAVYEAYMDRDAMVILGGNGPLDVASRRPGIDWIHTALVPNEAVRNIVKWDDQPFGLTSTVDALIRAYRVSEAEPAGPVYLSIDSEFQEQRLTEKAKVPRVDDYPPLTVGEGSLSALEKVADYICEGDHPVLIADDYGTGDASVRSLVALAEHVGAAVLDSCERFNMPSNHPLNLTGFNEEILGSADTVVLLGVKDIYFRLAKESKGHFSRESELMVRPSCRVVRIDMEAVSLNSWVSEYGKLTPTTMNIAGNPVAAVQRLLQLCSDRLASAGEKREKARERIAWLASKTQAFRTEAIETAKSKMGESPLALSSIALAVWEAVRNDDWVLAYPYYTPKGINYWARRIWEITKSYQYPGLGGGTGTGIGRAVGASLANRGRLCVDFQPDGDLLYSASTLWTAAHSQIPLLILVMNNHSYYNDEEHQKAVARYRNRPVENSWIGIRIENPDINFGDLARSYGLNGSGPVNSLDQLKEGLQEGIRSVMKDSKGFLLDINSQPR